MFKCVLQRKYTLIKRGKYFHKELNIGNCSTSLIHQIDKTLTLNESVEKLLLLIKIKKIFHSHRISYFYKLHENTYKIK